MQRRRRLWLNCVAALVMFGLAGGNAKSMAQDTSPSPKRDINAVLRDHDDKLLAIPGVTGVSVAVLEDGKTPCLKVMLTRKTPETERDIPKTIEGYPVVSEVTGEIRPLKP